MSPTNDSPGSPLGSPLEPRRSRPVIRSLLAYGSLIAAAILIIGALVYASYALQQAT